ncbi:esterase-like activity of phytase family protein [Streptomyces sp. ODS28]|uniref:esterase-like activity of phytase family protein n=1 Tax=Streptomyces sp. ODS28 TaxID=3136688 RepID=UPI0031E64C9D
MTVRPRAPLALTAAVLALLTCAPAAAAHGAGVRGGDCSPRAHLDGYSDAFDKAEHKGHTVGGISAIAPEEGGRLAALSDRSALYSLDLRGKRVAGAVPLADERGKPLDSEGLVVRRDGSRLVTSENEPSIRRYDESGRLTGRLPVPGMLRVAPAGRAEQNRTFEGLTAFRGGGHGTALVASMEGPLKGDGKDARGRPLVRFQTWDRHGRPGQQWAYPVDTDLGPEGPGVSETAATGDGRLLVLERGFDKEKGNTVRLYLADPRRAQDVRPVEKLTGAEAPVRKTLLADLGRCPDLGAHHPGRQTNPLLDNIEAMTVTGRAHGGGVHDGGLRVLLASDDNESAQQVTRLYGLTVRPPR